MLVQTGLPIYICHISADNHESFHFLQVIARCDLKFLVFHLTCEDNEFHIICKTQNTHDQTPSRIAPSLAGPQATPTKFPTLAGLLAGVKGGAGTGAGGGGGGRFTCTIVSCGGDSTITAADSRPMLLVIVCGPAVLLNLAWICFAVVLL